MSSFASAAAFRSAVDFLPLDEARRRRSEVMFHRIDADVMGRAMDALHIKQFPDREAYAGYLWDFLDTKRVVSEDELWAFVMCVPQVYAMTDLHSSELVRVDGDYVLGEGEIVEAEPVTLRRGLPFLPEDLYMFDATYSWVAALTHEEVDGDRFCLISGRAPRPDSSGQ